MIKMMQMEMTTVWREKEEHVADIIVSKVAKEAMVAVILKKSNTLGVQQLSENISAEYYQAKGN